MTIMQGKSSLLCKSCATSIKSHDITSAAWLAQLREHQSAKQEIKGSNPGPTNTQGL